MCNRELKIFRKSESSNLFSKAKSKKVKKKVYSFYRLKITKKITWNGKEEKKIFQKKKFQKLSRNSFPEKNFPEKTLRKKLSEKNFPEKLSGKTFRIKTFQKKLSIKNFPDTTFRMFFFRKKINLGSISKKNSGIFLKTFQKNYLEKLSIQSFRVSLS